MRRRRTCRVFGSTTHTAAWPSLCASADSGRRSRESPSARAYTRALWPSSTRIGRRAEAHPRGVGARGRVGGGRQLAHHAREALAGFRPQFHRQLAADGEARQPLLGDADRDFALAIGGEQEHRLPGRDDLPRLGQALADDAVARGAQHSVADLVAGGRELRAGLAHPRLGGAQRGHARVVERAADQLPVDQVLVARKLGFRQRLVRFGGNQRRARSLRLQARIGRIELGQRLAGTHAAADVHQSARQLAGHAEGQGGFFARMHLTRVGGDRAVPGRRPGHHRRPRRGFGGRLRAGDERQQDGAEGHGAERSGGGHERGLNSKPGGTLSLQNRIVQYYSMAISAPLPPSPPSPPGRPKDMEKRAAILDAAMSLFPARGYDGASVEAIAQAAGVSKLTVYSHFADKEALFGAAVAECCAQTAAAPAVRAGIGLAGGGGADRHRPRLLRPDDGRARGRACIA